MPTTPSGLSDLRFASPVGTFTDTATSGAEHPIWLGSDVEDPSYGEQGTDIESGEFQIS